MNLDQGFIWKSELTQINSVKCKTAFLIYEIFSIIYIMGDL